MADSLISDKQQALKQSAERLQSIVNFSTDSIPHNDTLKQAASLPLGAAIQPFGKFGSDEGEEPPLCTLSADHIPRCSRCFAYISKFADTNLHGGWVCAVCGNFTEFTNKQQRRYVARHVTTNHPELLYESYEVELPNPVGGEAGQDEDDSDVDEDDEGELNILGGRLAAVRAKDTQGPPVYIALVDTSAPAEVVKSSQMALHAALEVLPPCARVALLSFSDKITLWDLRQDPPAIRHVPLLHLFPAYAPWPATHVPPNPAPSTGQTPPSPEPPQATGQSSDPQQSTAGPAAVPFRVGADKGMADVLAGCSLSHVLPLEQLAVPLSSHRDRLVEAIELLRPDARVAGTQSPRAASPTTGGPSPANDGSEATQSATSETAAQLLEGYSPLAPRAFGPALLTVLQHVTTWRQRNREATRKGSGGPPTGPVWVLAFLAGPPNMGPGSVVGREQQQHVWSGVEAVAAAVAAGVKLPLEEVGTAAKPPLGLDEKVVSSAKEFYRQCAILASSLAVICDLYVTSYTPAPPPPLPSDSRTPGPTPRNGHAAPPSPGRGVSRGVASGQFPCGLEAVTSLATLTGGLARLYDQDGAAALAAGAGAVPSTVPQDVFIRLSAKLALGGIFRIRLPPGLSVGRFYGPAAPDPSQNDVAHIPTCTEHSTLCVDFRHVGNGSLGDGTDQPAVVLQLAFAYTCWDPQEAADVEDGYRMKRRLRVVTVPVAVGQDAHSVWHALNLPCITALLLHKALFVAHLDGYEVARKQLLRWLLGAVIGYQAAMNKFRGQGYTVKEYLFESMPEAHLLPKLIYALLTSPLLTQDFPARRPSNPMHPTTRIQQLLTPPHAPPALAAHVADTFCGGYTRLSDERAAGVALLTWTPPDDVARAIYPLLLSFESPDRQLMPRHSLSRAVLLASDASIWLLDGYDTLAVLYTQEPGSNVFPPPASSLLRKTLSQSRASRPFHPAIIYCPLPHPTATLLASIRAARADATSAPADGEAVGKATPADQTAGKLGSEALGGVAPEAVAQLYQALEQVPIFARFFSPRLVEDLPTTVAVAPQAGPKSGWSGQVITCRGYPEFVGEMVQILRQYQPGQRN